MSELRTAAQQALEALEYHVAQTRPIHSTSEAIDALRAALAQPEQDLQLVANFLKEYGLEVLEVIAALKTQPEGEFGTGTFIDTPYPEVEKFAELVIAAYTPPPHPIYLASDGRFYDIPQRQKPLPESEVNEMYREMFCSPRGKTLTHQNWFQAGVLFAEKAHGIGGEHE